MDARRQDEPPPAAEGLPKPAGPITAQSHDPTVFAIIGAVSFCHCLNDLIQSLLPAIYPILKTSYGLDFAQIGLITLIFQCTASLFQPIVGTITDKRPAPYSLVAGMGFSFVGLILLGYGTSYGLILLAAALIGFGSAVFHPESSRIARAASGGRHGMAQSVFQVGGNFGQAIGPLLAAFIVVPFGQGSVAWFSLVALLAMIVLWRVGGWYAERLRAPGAKKPIFAAHTLSRGRIGFAVALLVILTFSKNFYTASFTSYYTFYLMDRFDVSVEASQIYLFVAMAAIAAGVVFGGPIGDRIGRRPVILGSVLGVLPFTLILPHVNLFWTVVLTIPIGLIMASSLSAILVYALELVPTRVGLVAGLFFGLSFGMGGLGAAVLGEVADRTSIEFVYRLCAWLPLLGIVALLLPDTHIRSR
ncbi:MFS transporter [Enterovirga rhinocerotis]|uniref:FSR family fosmidomycin resistance protein-like MFS transporter n=1 Tax=Enterovirga rhinocerotis TaxID=1339210 RepID=A0A4R7BX49_9HYPH|nr:MFS transporter [Enterovirga rhinocerotis]TDR90083.1 FSR family fosmidomycin resistance protein-like MFS transporter [Enterovirga rhinocerotis]